MKNISVTDCSRCGGEHVDLPVKAMDRAFAPPEAGGIAWTHWATCPTSGDPIFVSRADPRPEAEQLPASVNGTGRFEEAVEWCYWRFDALRAGVAADRGQMAERDAFKSVLRHFYAKWRLGEQGDEDKRP